MSSCIQVIEFANPFQKIHKFYIDWDKKISEIAFETNGHAGATRGQQQVETVRQAALKTPAAVMRILHQLGDEVFSVTRGASSVEVVVKEGTRKLPSDWKVSFHFVFQLLLTTEQFKAVYEHLAQHISGSADMKMLSSYLLKSSQSEPDLAAQILKDGEWWCGLLGMDLHPRQNAFQGLACLGSRKQDGFPPSAYIGDMRVAKDGSSWEWGLKKPCNFSASDLSCRSSSSMQSAASTLPAGQEMTTVPFKQLPLKERIQIWLACSVIMPSPACIGASVKCDAGGIQSSFFSNSKTSGNNKKRSVALSENDDVGEGEGSGTGKKKQLWKDLLFESAGLKWFRDSFGGKDEVKKLFGQAYTNIQNISKPKEVSEAAQNKACPCPPWALVHISGSEACICSMKLMQVIHDFDVV